LVGLLGQSVFGWLAGYEDVSGADRWCRDPVMRWVGNQPVALEFVAAKPLTC